MCASPGDLYYALTHSPEPLTEEYSHALSWQAATERLEAAGSIPVKEAEEMAKALSSNDAGIEVGLFCLLLSPSAPGEAHHFIFLSF